VIYLLVMTAEAASDQPERVSITPLLKRLAYPTANTDVSPEEIASAFSLIFENRLTITQLSAFLTLLHSTGKDKHPEVIAKCASQVEKSSLRTVVRKKGIKHGKYRGGLVRPVRGGASRFELISSVV
jgi:anthranilate phosphoribosyltransferase